MAKPDAPEPAVGPDREPPDQLAASGSARRRFLKSLAVAPLATVQSPAPSPPAPEPRAAELLTDLVRARFGDQLDAAALEEVKKGIEGALQNAARLRRIPLGNADEPAITFEARPRRPPARRPR